ncbi:potassium transporter TrkA [Streptomyces sp. ZYX-F-203]
MDLAEALLPGVGLRYAFVNRDGDRIGLVAPRTGDFEPPVHATDPDAARFALRVTEEAAETLAEILGAPRIAERFADLAREVSGPGAGQMEVRADGPFAGQCARGAGPPLRAVPRDPPGGPAPGRLGADRAGSAPSSQSGTGPSAP